MLLINILHRKVNWIGCIQRRNSILHYAIKGKMTEMKAVCRRITQLFNDLKKKKLMGAKRGS